MRRILLGVAISLVLCATSSAQQIRLANAQVGVLRAPKAEQDDRFLLKFDLPTALANKKIDFAAVKLTLPVDTSLKRPVSFTVFAVSRDWDPENVTWSGSWTTPGGDFNNLYVTTVTILPKRNRPVVADLTPLTRLWAKGTAANFGIILVPIPDENQTYKLPTTPPTVSAEMVVNSAPRL
jgi:hypothetical protein